MKTISNPQVYDCGADGKYTEAGIRVCVLTLLSLQRSSTAEVLQEFTETPRPVLLGILSRGRRDGTLREYRGKWEILRWQT